MTLSAFELALYIVIWSFFYLLLVRVIAERSAQAWINRFDQDVNPEGADLLLHLLKPVMDEIFTDNETLLKDFKDSLFSKVARQVREAKVISKNFNPAGAAIDELTRDNPILGLILSHVNIPGLNALTTANNGDLTDSNPKVTVSNDDYGL